MRASRRPAAGLAAVLASAFLGACSAAPPVATVNGDTISRAQYDDRLEGKVAVSRALLAHMIDDMLIDQYAKSAGIAVSTPDVDARIAALKAQVGPDAWQEMLNSRSLTENDVSSLVMHQLILEQALAKNVSVSAAQIKAYYAKNHAQFEREHATLATATPQIVATLRTQQMGPLSLEFVQKLQGQAKIVFLDPRFDNLFAAGPGPASGGPRLPTLNTK